MKFILITLFSLSMAFAAQAQLDDKPFLFKKNKIEMGVGAHFLDQQVIYRSGAGQVQERYNHYSFTGERNLNMKVSVAFNFRYAQNVKASYNYLYREQALLLNYFPFGLHRRNQLQLSGGIVRSFQRETIFRTETDFYFSEVRTGLHMGMGYSIYLTPSFFVGMNSYIQFKSDAVQEAGLNVRAGVAF